MADEQQQKENEYKRKLDADRTAVKQSQQPDADATQKENEKESLFQRVGKGKIGRAGRAAISAGLLSSSTPGGQRAFSEGEEVREAQQADRQAKEQVVARQEQLNPEDFFGQGATVNEQTEPYQNIQSSEAPKQVDKNLKDKVADATLSAGKGAATLGQAAGKTAEVAGKGAEFAGKGIEAGGQAIKKGGQAMTRAGAELSGTGVGAIAGIPLAAAGLATTAAGAGVQVAGKGTQAAGKGVSKGGQAVAEGSGRAKDTLGKAKQLRDFKASAGDGPGEGYMNLARKLRLAKQKAAQGDVAGIVGDAVDTVAQFGTARALVWAWGALIPTFGLSVLYINFHFAAHYFLHSEKFCAFGQEWMSRKVGASGGAEKITQEATGMLEIGEVIAMLLVDVILGLIILISILVGYFVINPLEGLKLLQ